MGVSPVKPVSGNPAEIKSLGWDLRTIDLANPANEDKVALITLRLLETYQKNRDNNIINLFNDLSLAKVSPDSQESRLSRIFTIMANKFSKDKGPINSLSVRISEALPVLLTLNSTVREKTLAYSLETVNSAVDAKKQNKPTYTAETIDRYYSKIDLATILLEKAYGHPKTTPERKNEILACLEKASAEGIGSSPHFPQWALHRIDPKKYPEFREPGVSGTTNK